MTVTIGAQASAPHMLVLQIRTRILVSRIDPPRVVELVEYTDGRFGIQENGVPVAEPWMLGRIEACVRSYCSLADKGAYEVRRKAPGVRPRSPGRASAAGAAVSVPGETGRTRKSTPVPVEAT